jgi:hypothetical protein
MYTGGPSTRSRPRHSTGVHAQNGLAGRKNEANSFCSRLPKFASRPTPIARLFLFFSLSSSFHSLNALFVPAILPPITHFLYFHQTKLFISIIHHGRQRRPGMFMIAPRRLCDLRAPPRPLPPLLPGIHNSFTTAHYECPLTCAIYSTA